MCYKIHELCPGCKIRTGVMYLHKQDSCGSDPKSCQSYVEKGLRATTARFADVRCSTQGCLFSSYERWRIDSEYIGLGPLVAVVPAPGTAESAIASLPGRRQEGTAGPSARPAARTEPVLRAPVHPDYRNLTDYDEQSRIVTEYERDEQDRPIRRPLGRTRLPNGRMPLPTSRPPLASLGIRSPAPRLLDDPLDRNTAPNPVRARRNNNAAGSSGSQPAARDDETAAVPSTTGAAPASTPNNKPPASSGKTSTGTPRKSRSGRKIPEIPGRNGMTAILVTQGGGARPPKWQFRATGRLNLDDLPKEQAQEIRQLHAKMLEKIQWQTSLATRSGTTTQGPRYVLEEDQLLQLLRLSGFGFEQIQKEFMPRRTQDSLTVRRKGHKKGIHVKNGFEFIPDGGYMAEVSSQPEVGEASASAKKEEKVIESAKEEENSDGEVNGTSGSASHEEATEHEQNDGDGEPVEQETSGPEDNIYDASDRENNRRESESDGNESGDEADDSSGSESSSSDSENNNEEKDKVNGESKEASDRENNAQSSDSEGNESDDEAEESDDSESQSSDSGDNAQGENEINGAGEHSDNSGSSSSESENNAENGNKVNGVTEKSDSDSSESSDSDDQDNSLSTQQGNGNRPEEDADDEADSSSQSEDNTEKGNHANGETAETKSSADSESSKSDGQDNSPSTEDGNSNQPGAGTEEEAGSSSQGNANQADPEEPEQSGSDMEDVVVQGSNPPGDIQQDESSEGVRAESSPSTTSVDSEASKEQEVGDQQDDEPQEPTGAGKRKRDEDSDDEDDLGDTIAGKKVRFF
ncbi:hypothetical protein V8F20_004152 [Naviculisporaceae sp. PSN 640]